MKFQNHSDKANCIDIRLHSLSYMPLFNGYGWRKACYSAMHKKRYKPKFMFKGLKINLFRFFLGAFEKTSKNGDIATKPKKIDQFA